MIQGKKVLVVDDSSFIRSFLTRVLKRMDLQVCVAADGEEAIEVAVAERPDLIFMDVCLPGKSGYQVTVEIKQHPELRDTPVVFLSSQSAAEDGGQSFAAGGAIYLRKPINDNQLRDMLGLLLSATSGARPALKDISGESR